MAKVTCTVCGREIDARGMTGHMRTHSNTSSVRPPKGSQHKAKPKGDDTDRVISYPSNEQKIEETDTVVDSGATRAGHSVKQNDLDGSEGKRAARSTNAAHPKNSGVKKPAKKTQTKKKPVASKPASSSTSKPDPRGQLKTETEQTEDYHKAREWKGFFRD